MQPTQAITISNCATDSPSDSIAEKTNPLVEKLDEVTFIRERAASSSYTATTKTPLKEQKYPDITQDALHGHNRSLLWSRIRRRNMNAFSEFLGTFMFLLFAFGVTAQVTLSENKKGDYTTLCFGWGIGIMLGAYTAAPSGAHLNPAVTLSMCIYRKFPWRNLPTYIVAQTLGAFCAAGVVFANYKSAIIKYEGSLNTFTVGTNTSTAGIFITSPQPFMTTTGSFFSEFLGSAVLMFCIFALSASCESRHLMPILLGAVFVGISACFGWETGFALNVARDFGPRVMLSCLGYGADVWRSNDWYFWIPMIAPFLGCAFGGWLFDVLLNEDQSPVNTPFMGVARLWRWQVYEQHEGHIV